MNKVSYKKTGRIGLFDKDETSLKLSKLGNPLEKLHKVIDFEMFRSELESNMLNQDKKSRAGSKPYNVVMMFKIILLKRFYYLSEHAFKGKPLTDEQKENNRIKSKTRSRIEHVFDFVTNSMNDFYIQTIGFQRARGITGLINLLYNMCRYEQIVRLNLLPIKC